MKYLVHLQTFLVVSKTGSLTQAAGQLNVSVGAVSHRIKSLEEGVGAPLLMKQRGGMSLTSTGESLYTKVEEHIRGLENAMKTVNGKQFPFTVSVMPWLASSWLIPRLYRFPVQKFSAGIKIETSSDLANLADGETSAGLRFGKGVWANVSAEWLFDEWVTPMAHPDLIENSKLESKLPEEWPLLTDPDDLWPYWFSHHYKNTDSEESFKINTMSNVNLQDANTLAEAACTGFGVILGRFTQAYPLLRQGRLRMLTKDWLKTPQSHYLVRDDRNDPHPLYDMFSHWLKKEIEIDRNNLEF